MRVIFSILFLSLVLNISLHQQSYAGDGFNPGSSVVSFGETDNSDVFGLTYYFDLRERETFIQFTNVDSNSPAIAHIQIFNVGNLCNENNFFDNYTINDTHVYNMRDILTNDGNPSGVDLPENAYGIVIITAVSSLGELERSPDMIGNFRVADNSGYEYRTNAQSVTNGFSEEGTLPPNEFYSFNFNSNGGITLSDVVGITYSFTDIEEDEAIEATALPPQAIFSPFDIDIYDLNEVPFSCRDIIFSCVNDENPLLEEVLAIAGTANVASFEYGINNALPHSKGGELLCPGNIISDGVVVLRPEPYPNTQEFENIIPNFPLFVGYIGLNNGNGRGSMDSFWIFNRCIDNENCFQNLG